MNWISVEDRLPEEYGQYLIATEDGYVTAATYLATSKIWTDIVEEYQDYKDVTHWMPLPEPPNEEEEIENLIQWTEKAIPEGER